MPSLPSAAVPPKPVSVETHELYLHLLNLKQPSGESATDRDLLHRELARAPEGLAAQLNAEHLALFYAAPESAAVGHIEAIRMILDRAHLRAVNPRYWRPAWLKAKQSESYRHPSISEHQTHHRSFG